ncbi:histidine kinase [Mycobacterium sp. 852002-53434_SCH5985345]|nr:histidine kinase [Mycobacterium sp. 852002-53434_SCH5985345]OBG00190.1 histidine kinase [Mycobacterium sp. 852014-52450_SCH5900713]
MGNLPVCFGGAEADYYGDRVADSSDTELDRVRSVHQLRSYRIVSVLRICVVGLMVAAMVVDTPRWEWPQQSALVVAYAFVALCALVLAFTPVRRWVGLSGSAGVGRLEPFTFTILDVVALTGFQLLSALGILPLLIMVLLPVLVGVDVSSRRAAVVLTFTLVGFAIAGTHDRLLMSPGHWPSTVFLLGLYAFLCATAFVVVRIEERHVRSVAGLSTLREELLAQTMTASDVEQRRISESIHDGPLQDILAVRQELVELDAELPGDERVGRALTGLQMASERLRQATFELHPAVLEQVGLAAAVQQLAVFAARRSGIDISTDIDYPIRNAIDPIVFGVVRELLSNVVQHSRARSASVMLGITDDRCVLNVVDDGVGFDVGTVARRLGEGHIGLASHRARVDAAGGDFVFLDVPVGTHICVEVPIAK